MEVRVEGTLSLDFTVFLRVLESLERMLGVAFSREVRLKDFEAP